MRIITPKRHSSGYLYHSCPITNKVFEVDSPGDLMMAPTSVHPNRLDCCGYCELEVLDTRYRIRNERLDSGLIESEPPKAHDTYRGLKGEALLDAHIPHVWMEPKLDGVRAIVHCTPDGVFITTRRRSADGSFKQIQDNVPHLRDNPALLTIGQQGYTILDGELLMEPIYSNDLASVERDTLSMTMGVVGALPEKAIALQHLYGLARLVLFDCPYAYGESNEDQSLWIRRGWLNGFAATRLGSSIELISYEVAPDVSSGSPKKDFVAKCLRQGYEGAVLKDPRAAYRDSRAWLKIKQHMTLDAQVIAWEYGIEGGKYANTVGALAVAVRDRATGQLCEIATVNPGDDATREWLLQKFTDRADGYPSSPARQPGSTEHDYDIIADKMIVELEGQLMTRDGRIRHPRILRWRLDLSEPNEVDFNA